MINGAEAIAGDDNDVDAGSQGQVIPPHPILSRRERERLRDRAGGFWMLDVSHKYFDYVENMESFAKG